MAIISPARMAGTFEAGWFFNENQQLRYQFRQAAKPTARPDGSSLALGDVWIEVESNGNLVEWLWSPAINAGSWIGEGYSVNVNVNSQPSFNDVNVTAVDSGFTANPSSNIFIASITAIVDINGTANADDSWLLQVEARTASVSSSIAALGNYNKVTPGIETVAIISNVFIDLQATPYTVFRMPVYRRGNPGPIRANFLVNTMRVKR